MRRPPVSRVWRGRILSAVLVGVAGFVAADLLRMDPQPVPYVALVAVVMTLVWLVLDIVGGLPAQWVPTLPAVTDRTDEATADLRILSSHQQASVPTEAVRDRLVALARGRDPALAATLRDELGGPHEPARRLSPAEIDRILTRIEDSRDHR